MKSFQEWKDSFQAGLVKSISMRKISENWKTQSDWKEKNSRTAKSRKENTKWNSKS